MEGHVLRRLPQHTAKGRAARARARARGRFASYVATQPHQPMPRGSRPNDCRIRKEPIFNSLVVSLLQANQFPNGSIIDAGAHTGTETCLYAQAAPSRVVHAVEPLFTNVKHIANKVASRLPNVAPIQAGLGAVEERITPSGGMFAVGQMFTAERIRRRQQQSEANRPQQPPPSSGSLDARKGWSRSSFVVRRLDSLFANEWRGETLGFAHLDVEGFELDVLRGGVATLRRDLPVVATELFVHANRSYSSELLAFMNALGYDSYLIDEVCAYRMDCRNLLHWPRARRGLLEYAAAPMSIARAAYRLFPVDAKSVLDYAFPCCEPGGACCPTNSAATDRKGVRIATVCCSAARVHQWLEGQGRSTLSGSMAAALSPPLYSKETVALDF